MQTYENISISKQFSVNLLKSMSRRLNLLDISTLLEAEKIREAGLDLIRRDNNYGEVLISQAKEYYMQRQLSGEAFLIASSFQEAAESYADYHSGNFQKSIERMRIAIQSAVIINQTEAYNFTSRILHLLCNLLKIYVSMADLIRASQQAESIIFTLATNRELDIAFEDKSIIISLKINDEEREFYLDECLSHIVLVNNGQVYHDWFNNLLQKMGEDQNLTKHANSIFQYYGRILLVFYSGSCIDNAEAIEFLDKCPIKLPFTSKKIRSLILSAK